MGTYYGYSLNGTDWSSSYTAPTSDGTYTVYVRQTDRAGNVSSSNSLTFTLDTAVATPTVSLSNDTAGGLTGTTSEGVITLKADKSAPPADKQVGVVMANFAINFVMKATYSSPPVFVTVEKAE